MKQRKINLLLVLYTIIFMSLLLLSGYAINEMKTYKQHLKFTIEQNARDQARTLLRNEIDMFSEAIKKGQVDPNDVNSVGNWAAINFSGLRNGGPTCDGFVIELGSEQFIDDLSPDCQKAQGSSGRLMKDEPKGHKDPALCKKVLDVMRLGLDTKYGDNNYWNYDGSPEWLEWVIFPTNINLGLNDQMRTIGGMKNPNFKKYLFVLGTQQDEIFQPYNQIFSEIDNMVKIIYIILSIILFLMICEAFHVTYVEFHHKRPRC